MGGNYEQGIILIGDPSVTSFTEGSVLFYGSGGVQEDNPNFFWDDANDVLRVGSRLLDISNVTTYKSSAIFTHSSTDTTKTKAGLIGQTIWKATSGNRSGSGVASFISSADAANQGATISSVGAASLLSNGSFANWYGLNANSVMTGGTISTRLGNALFATMTAGTVAEVSNVLATQVFGGTVSGDIVGARVNNFANAGSCVNWIGLIAEFQNGSPTLTGEKVGIISNVANHVEAIGFRSTYAGLTHTGDLIQLGNSLQVAGVSGAASGSLYKVTARGYIISKPDTNGQSFTLKNVAGTDLVLFNTTTEIFTTPNLTIGSLGGVLKASAGAVSGSATTTDLPEGSNLYYTDARARAAITGTGNINVTNGVVSTIATVTFTGVTTTNLTVGSLGGVLKASSGVVSGSATTSDLTEGSNLYFTNARARTALSVTDALGNLTYNSGTGVFTLAQSPTFADITCTNLTVNTLAYTKSMDCDHFFVKPPSGGTDVPVVRFRLSGSTPRIGFFDKADSDATTVAKQSAITQDYATASTTLSSTDPGSFTGTNIAPWGFSSQANFDSFRNSVQNMKQVLNQVIDTLQAYGFID